MSFTFESWLDARGVARAGLLSVGAVVLSSAALAQVQIPPSIPPLPAASEYPASDGEGNPIDVASDVQSKGYHVSVIRSGVYWITDGNYHSLAVRHPGGWLLVDAPQPLPFFGNMPVLNALAELAPGQPVTHFVYSHAHADHIGGASAVLGHFPGAEIIAHKSTRAILEAANDPRRPLPTRTFKKRAKLDLGGQRVELHQFGDTHQPGNTFVWLPDHKVLMAVDIVYPGWVPFRRLALSSDIRGWLKGHDAVASFDFDVLVPGHLTRLGTRADVELAMEYNADIKAYVDAAYWDFSNTLLPAINALATIPPFNPFATEAKWALFSAFYDYSALACADHLNAKWEGVLAGGESFNFSNCEAYFTAMRLGDVDAPAPPGP